MNHEAELAQLLIQMGTDRGVDLETILAELSWAQFPSFVDAEAVRASLVDAVESWWRADLESRIDQLRNQYVAGAGGSAQFGANPVYEDSSYQQPAPIGVTPQVEPTPDPILETDPEPEPAPVFDSIAPTGPAVEVNPMAETASAVEPETLMPIPEPVEDATIEGMAVDVAETPQPPKSMPSDATMIWNTRGG
ncbi:MAG: hypothetical protein WBW04_14605 [Nitrolancea sp.]